MLCLVHVIMLMERLKLWRPQKRQKTSSRCQFRPFKADLASRADGWLWFISSHQTRNKIHQERFVFLHREQTNHSSKQTWTRSTATSVKIFRDNTLSHLWRPIHTDRHIGTGWLKIWTFESKFFGFRYSDFRKVWITTHLRLSISCI